MSKPHIPYFDFYPADFMNGVRGLTPQEVGVYTMILCRIYEESGPVEYHAERLATYCGMRVSAFEKTMERLIVLGKFSLSEGMLSNRRAETEIESRSNKLKINSRAGKESAKKRQQKQSTIATDVQRPFNHTEADTEATLSSVAKAPALGDFDILQSKLIAAVGEDGIQPHSALIVGPIAELISAGVSLELDILPTVKAVAARRTRPAASWSYFLPAIREAYEKRIGATRDLPKPKTMDESEIAWARRLRFARDKRIWSTSELGPRPGQPGCRVPASLLHDGDGEGWKEIENRSAA